MRSGTVWTPYKIEALTRDVLPYRRLNATVLISEIAVRRIEVIILCAPGYQALCDAVDVSGLMEAVGKLRDADVLADALASEQPVPQGLVALRDMLRDSEVARTQMIAPTSREREFPVTWYENPDR